MKAIKERKWAGLQDYMKSTWSIECHLCGETDEREGSEHTSMCFFIGKGWREVKSRKYQVQCAVCPECAQKPDKER